MNKIKEFKLCNDKLKVSLINYGGRFTSIKFKDKNNIWNETILNYENTTDYLNDSIFLNAFVGRTAGRIANSQFFLGDKKIKLVPNDGKNFLHGGKSGIYNQFFDVEEINDNSILLKTLIKEEDDNIPGDIKLKILIELDNSSIKINYFAESSKNTIINLTNHNYWNLNSNKNEKILNHKIDLSDTNYLELDDNQIPTKKVNNISFNGEIKNIFKAKDFVNGVDHFFEVKNKKLYLSNEKLQIEFQTSEPGFVVYTANNINNIKFKDNLILNKWSAICFEDQNFMDSINNNLGNWNLKKEKKFFKQTKWTFNDL